MGIRDMASNSALHLKVQTPWCQTFKVDVYNPLQYKEHWAYSVLSLYGMYLKQFAVPELIPPGPTVSLEVRAPSCAVW
jgi:hypothetical protein